MTRKPARADVVASLTMLVDPGTPAAAPEDQLARALLELRTVEAGLRRLAPELPPRLRGPAGRIAERIGRELERAFPEVV